MEILDLLRMVAALAVVLGLAVFGVWALRRWGGKLIAIAASPQLRRLAISEQLAIDPRRRLLLIRRDDVEHLILLTGEGASVIENGISPLELRSHV
jgi:flagellar protein FliO/FliZ